MAEKAKVSCVECGATNNFPLDSIGKTVVCGRCRSPLPLPGKVLEPSVEKVYNLLNHGGLPILIDFYSPTCAPCHLMHPIVEKLAMRRAGEIIVLKLNTGLHQELAERLEIRAVPTFVIFLKGLERGRASGAMSEADFSFWVASKA